MLVNLNEVLYDAQKHHYGVGLFNTTDTDMLEAVIEAAEKKRSPVIIGTAEILLPYGELALIAPSTVEAAKRASVPVVVHYDHGLTFERCMEALKLGYSSVMFDGSVKPYAQNIEETREIVRIAHAFGATVEGEIGHVGCAVNGEDQSRYTTVEEAKQYLADTGVDALAIAIGTAHGAYKTAPQLSFERLREIRSAVNVPLVLHGGSGLSDHDFRQSIADGIAKVNIFTDICLAGLAGQAEALRRELDYLKARNLKKDYMREAVERKIDLFGSAGRA